MNNGVRPLRGKKGSTMLVTWLFQTAFFKSCAALLIADLMTCC